MSAIEPKKQHRSKEEQDVLGIISGQCWVLDLLLMKAPRSSLDPSLLELD